ncbi:MAG TPA: hypothetical protein VHT34_05330 [Clostridia bacterium]|nr:hypothetical protein [Clostridia bacterium]
MANFTNCCKPENMQRHGKILARVICICTVISLLTFVFYGCGSKKVNVECMLKGKVTGSVYNSAKVLLCKIEADNESDPLCRIDASLAAKANDKGIFKFSGVPEGEYVILYASENDLTDQILKSVDQAAVYYKRPVAAIGSDGKMTQDNLKKVFDFDQSGYDIKVDDQKNGLSNDGADLFVKNGSLRSAEGGLTLEYIQGVPVSVKVSDKGKADVIVYVTEKQ